jgi:hypothetical protein
MFFKQASEQAAVDSFVTVAKAVKPQKMEKSPGRKIIYNMQIKKRPQ